MSIPAIRVEGLGKKYLIRHEQRERYTALRDVLANKAKSLSRRIIDLGRTPVRHPRSKEEFWALKGVSFEVQPGERVGIIGRNGAGKSTLLKLLSRITEPSAGRFQLRGRVGSLLEVGTGFHPELTGRENIFLNGAILGMGKQEIQRKFDEIVAFAEIEKFLDTPVKRYSSGMYVRLAFAVAAHLETEILVVDEVLAVGDSLFQQKCLGRMEEVGRAGRTVLFVSHTMGAVRRLCDRTIVLAGGRVAIDAATLTAIDHYTAQSRAEVARRRTWDAAAAPGGDSVRLREVRVDGASGAEHQPLRIEEPVVVALSVDILRRLPEIRLSIFVTNREGTVIIHSNDAMSDSNGQHNVGPLKL